MLCTRLESGLLSLVANPAKAGDAKLEGLKELVSDASQLPHPKPDATVTCIAGTQ